MTFHHFVQVRCSVTGNGMGMQSGFVLLPGIPVDVFVGVYNSVVVRGRGSGLHGAGAGKAYREDHAYTNHDGKHFSGSSFHLDKPPSFLQYLLYPFRFQNARIGTKKSPATKNGRGLDTLK